MLDSGKVRVRALNPEETSGLQDLVNLFGRVFEMDVEIPSRDIAGELMSKGNFFAVVAENRGRLLGGLSFYLLRRTYNPNPWGYIMDLAVDKEFQRQGIGQKLISYTRELGKKQGVDEIFVQAETEDTYAVDFYRKTAPSGELDVSHFFYKLL